MSHSDEELRWGEDEDEDLKWDSESGDKSKKQSTSWEDLDVEEIETEEEIAAKKKKQQEEEEKRAKEEKKKQREQKEERKKEIQEKKKVSPVVAEAGEVKKGEAAASGKKISNMLQEAMEKKGDFDAAVDLFQGAEKPRIELLNPKTEKEFDEFAAILADKINEFQNDRANFTTLLVKLLERTTENLKYEDFKLVREKSDEISKKKQKQKEEEKKLQQLAATKKKKASLNVEKNADPFADLSTENVAPTGSRAQFDDDDFM